MTKKLIVFLAFINLTCQDTPSTKVNTLPQYKTENKTDTISFYSKIQLNQLWDTLCQKKGCLTGRQYAHEGQWGGEGYILTQDEKWSEFLFKIDKKIVGAFLIQQLKDKTETKVHTCPNNMSTKGELALYCLQGILKKNFYDLSNDKTLSDKMVYKKYGSEQNWIWHIQNTKREVELLQELWAKELDKM